MKARAAVKLEEEPLDGADRGPVGAVLSGGRRRLSGRSERSGVWGAEWLEWDGRPIAGVLAAGFLPHKAMLFAGR